MSCVSVRLRADAANASSIAERLDRAELAVIVIPSVPELRDAPPLAGSALEVRQLICEPPIVLAHMPARPGATLNPMRFARKR